MSSNEEQGEHEELSKDDIAWSNMSYSERLVWWVNNKVFTKPDQSNTTEQPQSLVVEDKPQEVVQEAPQKAAQEVAQEEPVESVLESSGDSSPAKKRSGKGKKINISLE